MLNLTANISIIIIVVLNIGSQNIEVEYKLGDGKIKKIYDECDVGVGFDDTFKADNHILSIVAWISGMIGCMVRSFHFKGGKYCFKNILWPNKTSYRILYSGLASSVEKLKCNIEIGGHRKKNDENHLKI